MTLLVISKILQIFHIFHLTASLSNTKKAFSTIFHINKSFIKKQVNIKEFELRKYFLSFGFQ